MTIRSIFWAYIIVLAWIVEARQDYVRRPLNTYYQVGSGAGFGYSTFQFSAPTVGCHTLWVLKPTTALFSLQVITLDGESYQWDIKQTAGWVDSPVAVYVTEPGSVVYLKLLLANETVLASEEHIPTHLFFGPCSLRNPEAAPLIACGREALPPGVVLAAGCTSDVVCNVMCDNGCSDSIGRLRCHPYIRWESEPLSCSCFIPVSPLSIVSPAVANTFNQVSVRWWGDPAPGYNYSVQLTQKWASYAGASSKYSCSPGDTQNECVVYLATGMSP